MKHEPLTVVEGVPLRRALDENKGRAFLFIDRCEAPDAETLSKITKERKKSGKDFLFSQRDVGSSLTGVYGPDAHWLLPSDLNGTSPVDWARKHLGPLIGETELFAGLTRKAEVKRQKAERVFFHTGDLGDVIAALPTIRQMGGGHLILGNRHGRGGREVMSQARFDVIAPLLEAQDYIDGVELCDDAPQRDVGSGNGFAVTHDFTRFREKMPPPDHNLATWQANYSSEPDWHLEDPAWLTDFLRPWLTVCASRTGSVGTEAKGRAIFARSERFHNPTFDWRKIVNEFPGALFVGLPEEFEAFAAELDVRLPDLPAIEEEHGPGLSQGVGGRIIPRYSCEPPVECRVRENVSYRPTATLLELAELIAGSDIFVGNQSCPCWVAMGMGHRLIQETDMWNLNSVVRRDNAEFRSLSGNL